MVDAVVFTRAAVVSVLQRVGRRILNGGALPAPAEPGCYPVAFTPFSQVPGAFRRVLGHTLEHKGKPLARGGRKATGLFE